jgi:hypothetical protein
VLGVEKDVIVRKRWLGVFTNNEAYKQTNSIIQYYNIISQQNSSSSLLQLISFFSA